MNKKFIVEIKEIKDLDEENLKCCCEIPDWLTCNPSAGYKEPEAEKMSFDKRKFGKNLEQALNTLNCINGRTLIFLRKDGQFEIYNSQEFGFIWILGKDPREQTFSLKLATALSKLCNTKSVSCHYVPCEEALNIFIAKEDWRVSLCIVLPCWNEEEKNDN